jgi:hypothetical protein
MSGDASRINGEKGGRPLGRKNNATLEKAAMLERIRQRVYQSADILVDAQLSLARGTSYLFKADTDDDGKARKPILVTDPEEIAAYLCDDYNALETTYYYITTEKPENNAVNSLFDRAFGKAAQAIELGGPGGEPLAANLSEGDRSAITELRDLLKQPRA